VRYRDKNNFLNIEAGSVTHTTSELQEQRKRKKELAKAQDRLR